LLTFFIFFLLFLRTWKPTVFLFVFFATRNGHYSGLDYDYRVQIGRASKHLLNVGRRRYLEENGYKAELVLFTHESLENVALLATPSKPTETSSS